MFSLIGTATPKKVVINEHCKLRQSSEMMQFPEVARDKVWFLTLLREVHIWDRVTLGGQVGGSDGRDGEGEGEGEGDMGAVEVGKVGLEDGQVGRRPAQCM